MADVSRRIRRLALWLGALPASLCLALAWWLGRHPGADALPQRDRPYGWLLDPMVQFGQWVALGGGVVFGLIAALLLIAAHGRGRSSAPAPQAHDNRGEGDAPASQ